MSRLGAFGLGALMALIFVFSLSWIRSLVFPMSGARPGDPSWAEPYGVDFV